MLRGDLFPFQTLCDIIRKFVSDVYIVDRRAVSY